MELSEKELAKLRDGDPVPPLSCKMSKDLFRRCYYNISEIKAFCAKHGIDTSHSILDIRERIEHFLETGKVRKIKKRSLPGGERIDYKSAIFPDTPVLPDFKLTREVRDLIMALVGPKFEYTVRVRRFVNKNKNNPPELRITVFDIIEEWKREKIERANGTYVPPPLPQLVFRIYLNAYMEDNPGKTQEDAKKSWQVNCKRIGGHIYKSETKGAVNGD